MIIKLNKPRFRSKILFIDYDWTLVKPKSGGTFPKDVNDWIWLRPNVPEIVTNYYKNGYAIFIFTNQSKDWKKDQIVNALSTLEIPLTICIAYDKEEYKPNTKIYNDAIIDSKVNKKLSFMCGDALGRPNDHSDCDLEFAKNIGVPCKSPEEFFPFIKKESEMPILKNTQEIIIMIGMPGSGKSTIAVNHFGKAGYKIIHGDEYKTSKKMIKAASEFIKDDSSIVFDATNPSKKKRAEYIEFAKDNKLPVRCIYMDTSLEESMDRNKKREKPVPRIVYNIYNKNFEMPTIDEGCETVEKI
jgi:bifunctional polynucleotide phosphatase/kinase